MIVTAITEFSKSRCKIEIDHQFAFVLYKGELRKYHLQEEKEICEQDYREILNEVLPKRARLRCMNLLQSRQYTEAQLRDKLKQDFYSPQMIEQAIAYVASFHYIDDMRYAEDYIMTHESTRSRQRITMDLYRKGLTQDTIEQAWEQWEEKGGMQDEQAMIRALLEKRQYDPEIADSKEKQRLYAFFMRKGYSVDQIRQALGEIWM